MELAYLLNSTINSIQNLKNYFEHQIGAIEEKVQKDIEQYKYGVLLERFFFSKSMEMEDMELEQAELEIVNRIVEFYDINASDDAGIRIKYKLKENLDIDKKYELNPQKAHTEFLKLTEQPQILCDSTLIMLLVKYEEAIARIYECLLKKFPQAYLNTRTISYAELVAMSSDMDEIKGRFIEQEIEEFMRQPLSDWYKSFSEKHKLVFSFEEQFEKFKEIYYRRNLIVHNSGVVNDVYLKNVRLEENSKICKGCRLSTNTEYLTDAFNTIQIILYGTFYAMRKNVKNKSRFDDCFFDQGYYHMTKGEWVLSEYIYSLLVKDKDKQEADRLCCQINYWISIKNQNRFEEISEAINSFDVSARSGQFKVAKAALLDDHKFWMISLKKSCQQHILRNGLCLFNIVKVRSIKN